MEKRVYKKYTEVYCDLEKYCEKCRKENILFLPAERILSEELKVSRMTLRKALEKAKMSGIISVQGKHCILPPQDDSLKKCGRILFLAAGFYGRILLDAFNRLWNKLEPKLDKLGAESELWLTREEVSDAEFILHCNSADVIILTPVGLNKNIRSKNFLEKLQKEKKVIALSEPFLEHVDNFIALDNIEFGRMAARKLLETGCVKPVFIGTNFNISMFDKRYTGFAEVLTDAGINVLPYKFNGDMQCHGNEKRRHAIMESYRSGADGAFIASDEGIEYVTCDLFRMGVIPREFKIITAHGSGEALTCHAPITCVNHATNEVVSELLRYLKALAHDPHVPNVKKLVSPEIYLTDTIEYIWN